MSLTWTIDGGSDTAIRLEDWQLVEAAYGCGVGEGGFNRDDLVLGMVPAMKEITVTESAASPTRLFTGYIGQRGIGRGPLGKVENRRQFDVGLVDLNTLWDDPVLEGRDSNRPEETDYVRMTWLIGTDEFVDLAISAGVVPNTNTVTLDARDYRGEHPRIVAEECMEASAKNCFLYDHGSGRKVYYDLATGTGLTSSAKITTVAADVDESSSVFAAEVPLLTLNPDRIYSKVRFEYDGGHVSVTDTGTETDFRPRATTIRDDTVKSETKATNKANKYLDRADTEQRRFTVSCSVPASKVNDILNGQRIQVQIPHLAVSGLDLSAWTYMRIARRTVVPPSDGPGTTDMRYRIVLEFVDNLQPVSFGGRDGGGTGGGTADDGTTTALCADCSRAVALLPSGMDSDLSLARGLSSMHAFDGTQLARYNCALNEIDSNSSVSGALLAMYAAPTYETVLLGDRAVYASIGPYGDARWTITDRTVLAAQVMDIDHAWLVTDNPDTLGVLDNCNRSVAIGSLGTSSGGGAWTVGGLNTLCWSVDGTHIVYGSTTIGFNEAEAYLSGITALTQDFTVLMGPFYLNAGAITDHLAHSLFIGDDPTAGPSIALGYGTLYPGDGLSGGWHLAVYNEANTDAGIPITTPTASTTYYLKWQHQFDGVSQAKMWATADPEPDWQVSRSGTAGDGVLSTPDRFSMHTNAPQISDELHIDELRLGSAYSLETRTLTDGALVADTNLDLSTTQIRRTPDGQHVYVLQGESTLLKYDRYLNLEDTITLADRGVGAAGFASVTQDWTTDNFGTLYSITEGKWFSYDLAGGGFAYYLKDLETDLDYHFPSLQAIPGGTGQQIVVLGSGVVAIVGYKGGADWTTDGSQGMVYVSSQPTQPLLFGDPAGAAQIQAFGVAPTGCWWLAGAAQDQTFEGQVVSGQRGWIMKTLPA